MDIEIIEYMKSSFSVEMANTYQKAFGLFSDINLEDFIIPYDEIYATVDDFDSTFIQQQFETRLNADLNKVLNVHGIFIADGATNDFMTELLESITQVEGYMDYNHVLDILNSEITDEEKVANVLDLVSELESEDFMNGIECVNPGIVRKLFDVFGKLKNDHDSVSNNQAVIIKGKAEWVKRLYSATTVEFKNCKKSILYPQLEEGLKFNLEFGFYFNLLWSAISELSNDDIAREFVGMCIISSDKSEVALDTIKDYVGKYFHDMDQIGRIIELATRQFLVSKQDNGVTLNPS